MPNAVFYLRYSSYNQGEQSIEGQRHDCLAYAEREGITVVGEYVDRAKSAQYDNRPDFQRMIADSAKRAFDTVIVWKLDRFARNRRDAANTRFILKKNGVKLLSACELINENPEGIILESLLDGLAEYYSKNLSQNVKRGLRESVSKGYFLGGYVPYGFKVVGTNIGNDKIVGKKLVIDPETAPIVRQIFIDYANGKSKKQIIDDLNARGIPSWNGKKFTQSSFQRALKNIKYIGKIEHGGQLYDNYCPAIIDEDTFYRAQEKLKSNKRDSGKNKAITRYLLSGKVFCGHCGGKMVGVSGTSKTGATHNYYACAKWYKYRSCDKKSERKSFLESYIVEQAVEYVLRPERLQLIAERVVAEYDKEFNSGKLQTIDSNIKKTERELDKLADDFMNTSNPALRKRIEERAEIAEARLSDLRIERVKMLVSVEKPLTVREVAAWLKLFTNGDAADPEFQERIIDTFINSVYLYDDKLIIYFNVKDGQQSCYIDYIADADALNDIISDASDKNAQNPAKTNSAAPNSGAAESSYIKSSGGASALIYELYGGKTVYFVFKRGLFGVLIPR